MKKAGIFLLLALLGGIMLNSCIKKEDFNFKHLAPFQYSPNVAAPLIHSKLTLENILNDYDTNHVFVQNGNHFLYLEYFSTVFSVRADQLIVISDQNVNSNWSFSTGAIPVGDSASSAHSTTYTFVTPAGERLDSIIMKSGFLNFSINGNINHNAKIYISIPTAKKNGIPFQQTVFYAYTGNLPVLINVALDLSGYTFSFTSGNQITINYNVEVYGDSYPDNSPYTISMGESLNSLLYKEMFGYFGQQSFTLNKDSVSLKIFHNNLHGSMYFEDPRIYLKVYNAYGMPINISFDLLNAISLVNPPYTLPINGTGLPNPWGIGAPTYAQLGQSVLTSLALNQTNSNVKTAINMSPKFVTYHLNGLSNPNGNPVTDKNFLIDTSRFDVDVQVELPMYGRAWDFELQDTFAFDFGQNIDYIDWVKFVINTDNGFPVDASIQVYFADNNNVKIDSLLAPNEQIVQSGVVGPAPDLIVSSPTHREVEIYVYKNRILNMRNVKKIFIYSKLNSTNNGTTDVKFYSFYNVDVKLGVQVQGNGTVQP